MKESSHTLVVETQQVHHQAPSWLKQTLCKMAHFNLENDISSLIKMDAPLTKGPKMRWQRKLNDSCNMSRGGDSVLNSSSANSSTCQTAKTPMKTLNKSLSSSKTPGKTPSKTPGRKGAKTPGKDALIIGPVSIISSCKIYSRVL